MEVLEGRALLATLYVDVHNTTGLEDGSEVHPYSRIQAAIDHSAPSGDTVKVAAGVYAEALTIPHALTLAGPNAGISPNTGTRQADAVVVPPVNNPGAGRLILIRGDGVTIDGLTLDGHNAALGAGTPLNGVDSHAASGISTVDTAGNVVSVSGLTVQNNVIQNLTAFGVIADINDFTPGRPLAVSTGNAIRDNRIDNLPSTSPEPARGISIEHNFYADVIGNVITRATVGIQAIFSLDPDPSGRPSIIGNNTIRDYSRGIYLWTIDNDMPTAYVVANNVVSAEADPQTSPTNAGIVLDRVLHTTGVTLTNNTVNGSHFGVDLQYVTTSQTVTISGGTLAGNAYGVRLTNLDALPADLTPRAVRANLAGVTVRDSTLAGLLVDDVSAKAGATVTLGIDAASTVSGNPHGAILSGPNASVVESVKPIVSLTSTPPTRTTSTSAAFAIAGSDNVTTPGDLALRYRLDGGALTATSSLLNLSGLAVGAHTLVVEATDQAGNAGTASYSWTVTPPPPSTPALDAGSDTGSSSTDRLTADRTPTFVGTAPAGSTVALFSGSAPLGSTAADGSGRWSFTVGGPGLANGSYAITATATDASGISSPASSALTIVIDATAPAVSLTGTPPAATTETSASFAFTASDAVTAAGDLLVQYSLDGGPLAQAGSPVALDGLAVGTHTFLLRATDRAGNAADATYKWAVAAVPPPPAPSTPALDAGSDTGSSSADGITADNTPKLTGTATAGSTVTVLAGSTALGTTTADGTGRWAFTVGGTGSLVPSLADGSYAITATATDGGGRTSLASGALAIVVDTTRPAVALTNTPASKTTDTSASFAFGASDAVTTAGGLALVYRLDGGAPTPASSPVDVSGLALGAHTFLLTATDEAGNVGSAPYEWTVVAVPPPPAPSTPVLDAGSDTGSSSSDGITADDTPSFSGTATAGTTVTLFAGTTVLGSTTARGSGDWSFAVGGAGSLVDRLAGGTYAVTATATDGGGRTSLASGALTIVVDTAPPSVVLTGVPPALTASTTASFAFTASDNVTAGGGLSLRYRLDKGPLTPAASPLDLSGLAVGAHTLVVEATDQAGNAGTDSSSWTVTPPPPTIPPPPSTPAFAPGSDTGASATDGITADNTPTFTGTALAGGTVTVLAGTTPIGTTTADGSGRWSFTVGGPGALVPALADGIYGIFATVANASGGVSPPSAGIRIVVDATAPVIQVTRSPLPNAAGWNNTDVTGGYTAQDALSGLASPASGSVVFNAEGQWQWRTFTASDVAGNSASATVGWVQIDKTAPVVTIAASPKILKPADGRRVTVKVTGTVSDWLSGPAPAATYTLRDSSGLIAGGGPVQVRSDGKFSFSVSLQALLTKKGARTYTITVNAQDAAGNPRSASATVTVPVAKGSSPLKVAGPVKHPSRPPLHRFPRRRR